MAAMFFRKFWHPIFDNDFIFLNKSFQQALKVGFFQKLGKLELSYSFYIYRSAFFIGQKVHARVELDDFFFFCEIKFRDNRIGAKVPSP